MQNNLDLKQFSDMEIIDAFQTHYINCKNVNNQKDILLFIMYSKVLKTLTLELEIRDINAHSLKSLAMKLEQFKKEIE